MSVGHVRGIVAAGSHHEPRVVGRPLPLAAAQARLGKPGRPRKRPIAPDSGSHGDKQRDNASAAVPASAPCRGLAERGAPAVEAGALLPRLLTVALAAAYLSLSEDVVLELMAAGILTRVTVPAPVTAKRRGGVIRRVLLDRHQLDAAVAAWARAAAGPR
jgi:hypothetical protein